MPKIDVDALLRSKAPVASKYIPGFVKRWLRRTIHQDEINFILEEYSSLPPQEFIRSCFRFWGITYSAEGLDALDPAGRYIFASNHPFGGMDGMMLSDLLISHFGDAKVVVNDLLTNLEPLDPLWLPVNKHGRQSSVTARRFDEVFLGDVPVLTFPAGLCSRRRNGVIADPEWKSNFVKRAVVSQRQIVPVFVEGRLSNFFYNLSSLRRKLGIKFNIEMLYLPDEMFSQKGRHFRIIFGDPIPVSELHSLDTIREQVNLIRKKTYFLGRNLASGIDIE